MSAIRKQYVMTILVSYGYFSLFSGITTVVYGSPIPSNTKIVKVTDGYVGELANGAVVELVAVSHIGWQYIWQHENDIARDERLENEYWWTPDGTRVESPSFKRSLHFGAEKHRFEFVVRITDLDDCDITVDLLHPGYDILFFLFPKFMDRTTPFVTTVS